jgi:SAM-dependent methyltransferase
MRNHFSQSSGEIVGAAHPEPFDVQQGLACMENGWQGTHTQRAALVISFIPLLLAAGGGLIARLRRDVFNQLVAEDGVVEDFQVIFWLLAFILLVQIARRFGRGGNRRMALLHGLLAAGILFLIGEELSWGRRVVGWTLPAWWKSLTGAADTNLHEIPDLVPLFNWGLLAAGAYGSLMPLLASRGPLSAPQHKLIRFAAPPSMLAPYFLVAFVWAGCWIFGGSSRSYRLLNSRYSEVVELILALGFFLFMYIQLERVSAAFKTNRLLNRRQAAVLGLAERIRLEMQLTDADAARVVARALPASYDFEAYRNRSPWRRHLFGFLGPLQDRAVLDVGCGYNPTPIYLALGGARHVVACDVSPKAVAHARDLARATGVANRVAFFVAAAEQLPLASGTVEAVHAESVLHHLALPLAGKEIRRVLKQGGKAAFKDPLGGNPLLEFARDYLPYRWKKAAKGTDRPLTFAEIQGFGSAFTRCTFRGFGLISMLAVLLVGRGEGRLRRAADAMDERLLRAAPFLQRYCRFVVTCVEK